MTDNSRASKLSPVVEQIGQLHLEGDIIPHSFAQHPGATLEQLCEYVRREQNITASTTGMSRLLRKQGLACRAGRRLPH